MYYNAYSEDLFIWDNDLENGEINVQLDIRQSSLNRFHSSLSEDDIRDKLNRYRPNYRFDFIPYDNPEDGIKSVMFFDELADPADPNKVSKIPRKISRGEERIFVWCFFLALFEVEGWADKQSSHFFIDDPVSSLDDHNIFITASTIYDLIEEHYEKRKFVVTTHHIGLFSILSDMLTKGEKASKFKKLTRVCTLSLKSDEVSLESCRNDVFLYLIGQFAAGSGKKAGEFYTPQQISDILSAIVTLDSQEPKTGTKKRLESVLDFACGSGSFPLLPTGIAQTWCVAF